MFKLTTHYALAAVALPLALTALPSVASLITIDPDGAGAQASIQVDALDWNQGSLLAVDAIPLTPNLSFRSLSSSRLGNFQLGGNPLAGTGLNATYEWTTVFALQESVSGAPTPQVATFNLDSTAPSLLQIWYDPARDTNQLAGTGFNNGTLILSAQLALDASGVFFVPNPAQTQLLDQFGGDNWAGQQTLSGTGSNTVVTWEVISFDASFFPAMMLGSQFDVILGNVSQQTPFQQVDPSRQLWDPLAGAYNASNVGSLNLATGPDGLFQSDYNTSFRETPEPGTLALLGLGVAGFAVRSARRRSKTAD